MSEKKDAEKQKIKTLKQALLLLDKMGSKPKMTTKQFKLITKVKISIKGVQNGTLTLDKLIEALINLNESLSKSFKL